jgi:hypothetical protein
MIARARHLSDASYWVGSHIYLSPFVAAHTQIGI